MIPDLVRKVPNIVSRNVAMTSETFHNASIWRRSWTMTEWRKAVAVSQGSKLAFSTGSQAQYPPQPSTSYAHQAPAMMPTVRKIQGAMIQCRTARIQSPPIRPVIRAPIPKANGTVIPT